MLLDSDMLSVDIWQLVNWPTRWARAVAEMSKGHVLVLPAFQLTPAGMAAAAAENDEAAEVAAMRTALRVVTAGVQVEMLGAAWSQAAYSVVGVAGCTQSSQAAEQQPARQPSSMGSQACCGPQLPAQPACLLVTYLPAPPRPAPTSRCPQPAPCWLGP